MRFVFGDCELDTEHYELRRAGRVVALEPMALRVLAYLLRQSGRAVTKQDLLQTFWPGTSEVTYKEYSLRNCLMKIRQAVGDTGTPRAVIETIRGYGYRCVAAVTTIPPDAIPAGDPLPGQADDRPSPFPSAPPRVLPGRRQLTVLRCAMVEEPAFVRLDPEDFQSVIQAFYRAGETVIARYKGYIAQYDSDGLLVYFGYPTADEAAALQAVRAGLALVHKNAERYFEAEIYRLRGELLLHVVGQPGETEACFQQALAIARRQQAKSWELRAAMSLARLWQQQGKRAAAYDVLAPVHGWFTEGFDTADLQAAQALLEELGA